jgi:hypothetical protein
MFASAVRMLLDELDGVANRKRRPDSTERIALHGTIVGAALDPTGRDLIGRALESHRSRMRVCLSLVGLLAEGTDGWESSLVWPLLLPLAPHAEHVEAALAWLEAGRVAAGEDSGCGWTVACMLLIY